VSGRSPRKSASRLFQNFVIPNSVNEAALSSAAE
jgi:hypothetical protein